MKHAFFCLGLAAALAASTSRPAAAQARKPARKPTSAKPAAPSAASAKPLSKPMPVAAVAAPVAPAPTTPPAQHPAAAKAAAPTVFGLGINVVHLGVGLGSAYGYGAGLIGGSSSVSPAISLSYERSVVALGPGYIGVGGLLGYQGASYDLGLGDKWTYRDVVLNARGAFHYAFVPRLDTYAGLGLGVRYLHSSYADGQLGGSATDLAGGVYLGARYYFTPAIGGFAELGYDQSFLKIGLAAKF